VKQRDVFLAGEGKAWLDRNRADIGQYDPISPLIEAQGIKPKSVLEIGCGDGWRLRKLQERYGCEVRGVDPAMNADVIYRCTADSLPFYPNIFDLVVFGFCLYLTDPADHFRIVAEVDRVLSDGGNLVIHDFADTAIPYRVPYEHRDGVWSHHMAWHLLWSVHPAYRLTAVVHGERSDQVSLLRKDMAGAFREKENG
jgi:ubiquinone/menaquinone biosynthesis C-methylase UbiE